MGDIYIHAGDFSITGKLKEIQNFENFLSNLPHPNKIIIAGNHDVTIHERYYEDVGKEKFHSYHIENAELCRNVLRGSPNLIYLEDSGVNILGLNIWGRYFFLDFHCIS